MNSGSGTTRRYILLFLALVLVFGGGWLAYWANTGGGTVEVRDTRFMGSNGIMMSGLLYVPRGVTAQNPAPGIVAIHGYINARETQAPFAIEYARRGYVVLALDQTGHGYSDPPAFAGGFGGPAGLAYLRTLDIVDRDNIGLEGHSMGGWASLIAAGVRPDDYQSIVILGSSTGTFGAPAGTPTWPRNLGLVFTEWDEFSQLMWGSPIPKNFVETDKLKTLFGTEATVVPGRLYGNIDEGTARMLWQPRMTHPWAHLSSTAVGHAVEWMQMTLEGGSDLAPSNQIWQWKEFGSFLGLVGTVLFMLAFGGLLIDAPFFARLRELPAESKAARGGGWWIAALIFMAIPAVTYFWLQQRGVAWFPPGGFWPQQITTGIAVWAAGNGVIALVLFLIWHFTMNRGKGATAATYGITWAGEGLNLGKIWRSLLLAALIAFGAYLLLALADFLFKIDFRLWVVALKLMSPLHFRIFLAYLLPFLFFFLVLGIALHGQLRVAGRDGAPSALREFLVNVVMMIAGITILQVIHYWPLLMGGTLMWPAESLRGIVAHQFVALLAIVALVSTYFYRKTGHVYVGAFLNAFFVTWYIVAGQATQFNL
jgi:pimeloyl-ACP methyl ester carboxylesterase